MNCKPGDLAYLSHHCEAEGTIVEVISAAINHGSDLPAWNCRSRTPVNCWMTVSKVNRLTTQFIVEDQYLRPISGVPVEDEQHDEAPIKETRHVLD